MVFNFLATSFLEALYRFKEKHVKVKHKHRQLISVRKVVFDIPGFKRSNRRLKFQIYLYLSLKDPIEFRVMKHSVAVYQNIFRSNLEREKNESRKITVSSGRMTALVSKTSPGQQETSQSISFLLPFFLFFFPSSEINALREACVIS